MAIKIIVDSTCDFTIKEATDLGLDMIHLKVSFGDIEYIDKLTISNNDFYKKLESSDQLPKTTQVNPDQFLEVFEKYPNDDIIVITLASGFSGTHQSAHIAKSQLGRDNIYLIDSETVSLATVLLIKEAIRMRAEGYAAPAIEAYLNEVKKRVKLVAFVDTLRYLVMGGRLKSSAGFIGGILGIKPLLMVESGALKSIGKAKGVKKGISMLLDTISENSFDISMPYTFAHSVSPANLQLLIDATKEKFGTQTFDIYELGSVIGAHAGPGAVCFAFFSKK